MAITCPQCSSENPDGFAFCGRCGAKLQVAEERAAKHHLAVLFCDLIDSTPISERLDPEDYVELIQAYQSRVGRIVNDWGGYIAQYLGDGILVYFGYPVAAEDDTQRALSAGLAMVRATERLSSVYLHDHGVKLQVRVGIHTGVVVAANVGEGQRADRLALGQTVNIAARVQGSANPGQVWLSESAYRSLRGSIPAASMGTTALKGIAEPMELFHADTDVFAVHQRREGPFVGRDSELDLIERSIVQGSSVCIQGEAGIGKSRLLEEIRLGLEHTWRWQIARCSNYHQNLDLYPFLELLKQIAGVRTDESVSAHARAVEAWLTHLSLNAEHSDLLRRMLGPDAGYTAQRRDDVLQALVECLRALPEETIFVLEDMHWADPSTIELVNLLTQTNVRMIVTTRSVERELPHVVSVNLDELTVAEMTQLVAERFEHDVSGEVVQAIVDRSDGVPFFAEELMRVVIDALKSESVDPSGALSFVPDSVHNAISARIDGLGSAKELVQVGSLLGRRFDADLLSAVVGRDKNVQEELRALTSSGLIQREALGDTTQLRFQHALVLDVAYSSLLKVQRLDLHEKVVATIVNEFPWLAEQEPQTLARHYEGAEMYPEALSAYQKAAGALRQRAAYDEAVSIYRLSLGILEKLPQDAERDRLESRLLRLLVSSLTAKGGYQSADTRPYLDRITAISNQTDDPIARYGALMAEWGFHTMIGHRAESEYYAEALQPYIQAPHDSIVRSNVHYALGSNAFYLGDYKAADQHFDDGLALLSESGYGKSRRDFDQPAFLNYQTKGFLQCLMGDLDGCYSLFETVLQLAREADASFAVVQSLIHLGFVRREREDALDIRLEELARAIELCREMNLSQWELAATRMAEWARLDGGEVDLLDACLDHYEPQNENTTITLGYEIAHSANTLLNMEEYDRAKALIVRARELVETSLGQFAAPEVLRVEAVLAAVGGDIDTVEEKFSLGLEEARRFSGDTQALKIHLALKQWAPSLAPKYEAQFQDLLPAFANQTSALARRALSVY